MISHTFNVNGTIILEALSTKYASERICLNFEFIVAPSMIIMSLRRFYVKIDDSAELENQVKFF